MNRSFIRPLYFMLYFECLFKWSRKYVLEYVTRRTKGQSGKLELHLVSFLFTYIKRKHLSYSRISLVLQDSTIQICSGYAVSNAKLPRAVELAKVRGPLPLRDSGINGKSDRIDLRFFTFLPVMSSFPSLLSPQFTLVTTHPRYVRVDPRGIEYLLTLDLH